MNQNCRILRIASSNSRDRERSRRGAASPFHVASTSTMVRHASHRMVNAHTKNHVASNMDNGQNLSLMQRTSQILGPPVGYASFSIESVDIGAILTLYRVSVLHVWHILVVFHKRLHSKAFDKWFCRILMCLSRSEGESLRQRISEHLRVVSFVIPVHALHIRLYSARPRCTSPLRWRCQEPVFQAPFCQACNYLKNNLSASRAHVWSTHFRYIFGTCC